MADQEISRDVQGVGSELLDHSRDFVELVYRSAPGEYLRLIGSEHFQQILKQQNNFNYGKLYAYAEFVVFRREFNSRFPDARKASCINTFSALLLKNDISITNLVNFMEGSSELEQLRLKKPGVP